MDYPMLKGQRNMKKAWRQYLDTGDPELRVAFLNYYSWVVKLSANRMATMLPGLVREDLIDAGVVGLVKAIDDYHPSFTDTFQYFAADRIWRSILKSLCAQNRARCPRRDQLVELDKYLAAVEFERKLGSYAWGGLALTGETRTWGYPLFIQLGCANRVGISHIVGGKIVDDDDNVSDPEVWEIPQISDRRVRAVIISQIFRLSIPGAIMVGAYYFEGMTFPEIRRLTGECETYFEQCREKVFPRLTNRIKGVLGDDPDNLYAKVEQAFEELEQRNKAIHERLACLIAAEAAVQ